VKRRAKILFFLFLILLFLGGFFGFRKNVLASDACNNHIIISEIYGGGGNSGATYKNDFIELYNPTTSDIVIDGWSVQYNTSASSGNFLITKLDTKLENNIIKAGEYYLIQEASGSSGVDLPTTDAKGNIAMSATAGKVALVDNAEKISTMNDENVVDFVGYGGAANEFEGLKSAPSPNNTQSIARKSSVCLDSNNNGTDFTAQDPTPGGENEKIIPVCVDKIILSEIYPFTGEFVEVENIGAETCNLAGWKISDEKNSPHAFPVNSPIEPGGYVALIKDFNLNSTSADSAQLFNPTNSEPVEIRSYKTPENNKSYSNEKSDVWKWTSKSTSGLENVFDEETPPTIPPKDNDYAGKIKINEVFPAPKDKNAGKEFVEIINISNENINLSGMRIEDEKNHKVYFTEKILAPGEITYLEGNFELNNTTPDTAFLIDKDGIKENSIDSVTYEKSQYDYAYAFDGTTWRWNNLLTPGEKNEFEKKLKVSIVKIKANPKGKDADLEEVYLQNKSQKKINLKTWSLATGSKTLYNHPITKNFILKPGKTKKITRKYSLFTLNNKKGAIELRYPNGAVASRVKYDKKKESVKDDEVYELSGKDWQWNAPVEEIPQEETARMENISPSEENPENINPEIAPEISEEEITLNLGKYSAENKLALAEMGFLPASEDFLQSREAPGVVLGAFSARAEVRKSIEIKSTTVWQRAMQKSNRFFNFLINRLVNLI